MADIVMATFNARYAHASFGLRYLMGNLGPLAPRAKMLEFEISHRAVDALEAILSQRPRIIGLGVYIWNVEVSTQIAAQLKCIAPEVILILGGPEVSHETDQQEITRFADYVITGEADLAFAELCSDLLAGRRPLQKIIAAELPAFAQLEAMGRWKGGELKAVQVLSNSDDALTSHHPGTPSAVDPTIQLPYHLYTDEDLGHRVVYIEASRGCPFKCEFCLSSLDVPVRNVPLELFLPAMQALLDRGLRQFKFVDRTFNLNLNISKAILEFFLERLREGIFLHFEMIPDRLPEQLRSIIARFPPGALQFEVGVQTFNQDVAARISRRQDNDKVEQNLRFLREQTGVHVHADLIVGLPGEDIASFAAGFDRLVALGPQEIQVGMLKRLRGTPIARHDQAWQMVYTPHAPYEVLQTSVIDFATMQRLRRFSRFWDLLSNSGNFRGTLPMLWSRQERLATGGQVKRGEYEKAANASPFWSFLNLSDRLHQRLGRSHGISLHDLAEFLFHHLTSHLRRDPQAVALSLWEDYQRVGRSDRPAFLRPYIADRPIPRRRPITQSPPRQARHLG